LTHKLTYLFCFLGLLLGAQKDLALEKGSCLLFKKHVYAFGFRNNSFVVYKLKPDLQLLDSVLYNLDKAKPADYLHVDHDTIHDHLNFYLQKKDKQNATLLRFDNKFKLVNEFKNVEVTKLDPLAMFDHQKFVFKKFIYAVKTAFDTSGKRYYLSKYELQNSAEKPFDYKFKWQFNFEKKHIKNVHVFYADTNQVLAYVHINEGERKGQWVLKINASTGLIIKGKKISSNPAANYRYGNHFVDTVSKNTFILGQLTNGENLSSATPTLFILQFDSLLSLNSQKLIVQRVPGNPKVKAGAGFIFQLNNVKKRSPQNYEYQVDLYRNNNTDLKYSNTLLQTFSYDEESISADPFVIKEYPEIENYYFTNDKKDLNGKLFADTSRSTDRIFYQSPVFAVKQAFKLNAQEFPTWILKKTDAKTSTVNYSQLKPGAKVYELNVIGNNPKEEEPGILFFGKENFLFFHTKGGTILHLENRTW
jgi:hypothetical protein